ncbi:unnamed protein product [Clavelina lepadiformis]|uniref:Uncharacterized protein n=1 Tax=Clavelina lepadiformis TaxID=159417 RepID=A0ABP0FNS8_CLALP
MHKNASKQRVWSSQNDTDKKGPRRCSPQPIDVAQPSSPEDANSSFTIISPVELLPMPKATHIRQKRKSKRGATAILTSSPYKQLAATNRSQSVVSGNSSKTSSSKERSMRKAKVSRSSMQLKDTVDESDNKVDAERSSNVDPVLQMHAMGA